MKKRDLSDFMTQELLYDYVKDLLDKERRTSVEEVLERSEDIKTELRTVESGIQYLESLSKTQISTTLIQRVSERMTYLGQIQQMMSYPNWPPFVKWTLEAVLVITVVITISLVAPWGQVIDFVMQSKTSDLILAEIPKSGNEMASDSLNTMEKVEKGNFEDENESATTGKTTASPQSAKTETTPSKPVTAAVVAEKVETPKRQGFVYRGTLNIVNVEAGTVKLKEKLVELGGRKAGEVELGWRRHEGDFYFHFTIPESKLEELQEYFKTMGTITLSRDPHPRIMPAGILRMIITTEEAK